MRNVFGSLRSIPCLARHRRQSRALQPMSADPLPPAIRGSEATFEEGSRAVDVKAVERSGY